MQTKCVRQGQIEIGMIEHNGREFSALGATTIGRYVTGYTADSHGHFVLSSWCGQTMLATRSEVVQHFWSDTFAMMFRLTKGRFIVGYSLGEGMLFRGELLTDSDEGDARRQALVIADYFAELDGFDEETFTAEHDF